MMVGLARVAELANVTSGAKVGIGKGLRVISAGVVMEMVRWTGLLV